MASPFLWKCACKTSGKSSNLVHDSTIVCTATLCLGDFRSHNYQVLLIASVNIKCGASLRPSLSGVHHLSSHHDQVQCTTQHQVISTSHYNGANLYAFGCLQCLSSPLSFSPRSQKWLNLQHTWLSLVCLSLSLSRIRGMTDLTTYLAVFILSLSLQDQRNDWPNKTLGCLYSLSLSRIRGLTYLTTYLAVFILSLCLQDRRNDWPNNTLGCLYFVSLSLCLQDQRNDWPNNTLGCLYFLSLSLSLSLSRIRGMTDLTTHSAVFILSLSLCLQDQMNDWPNNILGCLYSLSLSRIRGMTDLTYLAVFILSLSLSPVSEEWLTQHTWLSLFSLSLPQGSEEWLT